jgi:hypothetical protein
MFCDDSVVSRLETGTLAPTVKTAQAADTALELPGSLASLREILMNFGGGQWAGDMAEMEKRATLLNQWEPCYLPGLLQTEPYMREVFLTAEPDATDAQIQQRVAERLDRQEIWQRADPPAPNAARGDLGTSAVCPGRWRGHDAQPAQGTGRDGPVQPAGAAPGAATGLRRACWDGRGVRRGGLRQ